MFDSLTHLAALVSLLSLFIARDPTILQRSNEHAHFQRGGGTMVGEVKDRGAATRGGTDRVEQSKSDIQSSTVVTTSNSRRALSSPQTLHTNQSTYRSLSPTDMLLQLAFSPTNTLLQPTPTTYYYHQPTHRLPSPTHSSPPAHRSPSPTHSRLDDILLSTMLHLCISQPTPPHSFYPHKVPPHSFYPHISVGESERWVDWFV